MKGSGTIMGEDLENQGKVLTWAWIVPFAYGAPRVHGGIGNVLASCICSLKWGCDAVLHWHALGMAVHLLHEAYCV